MMMMMMMMMIMMRMRVMINFTYIKELKILENIYLKWWGTW
jgi:hypothetical protein